MGVCVSSVYVEQTVCGDMNGARLVVWCLLETASSLDAMQLESRADAPVVYSYPVLVDTDCFVVIKESFHGNRSVDGCRTPTQTHPTKLIKAWRATERRGDATTRASKMFVSTNQCSGAAAPTLQQATTCWQSLESFP